MEIERKFLVKTLPESLATDTCLFIEQGYLSTDPVVRVRRQDDEFYLTYKSRGFLEREEYNLPLTAESYAHLLTKADGNIISKKRYLIPLSDSLTAELDIFEGKFKNLILVEVEFESKEKATSFTAPDWFGEEVTYSKDYQNSTLSRI